MQNEKQSWGCAQTYIPVRTLSVRCVTCHGPNIMSAVSRILFSPRCAVQQHLQHAVCSLLINERTQAFTRGGVTLRSTPRLLHTGTLQCHLHNRRCCLHHIPNYAGKRTIQVRISIVRVPAVVQVKSLGTYPHYRETPTVFESHVHANGKPGFFF